MADQGAASVRNVRAKRPARRRRWVPPQHGAWAMLLVPYLAGLAVAGVSWVDVPLLIAWVAAYLASYYLMLAVKTKRLHRVGAQLLVYGAIAGVAAAVTLVARPRLVLFAPVFLAVLAVNALFARQRDDRALANGVASVIAACLMVPITAVVADTPVGRAGDAFVVCLLFFVGSLLFVKTMFRERESESLRNASAAFHIVAVAAAGALSLGYVPAFVLFLARAVALPGRTLRPGRVGIVEVIGSLALLATLVII